MNSTFQPLPPCSPQLFSSCPSLSRVVWGRARAGSGDRDEREGRGRNEKGQEELGRVEEGAGGDRRDRRDTEDRTVVLSSAYGS